MPAPQTWGVSVDEVSALAPHITIKATADEQLEKDLVFGATQPRAVTVDQVEGWIKDVAGRVSIRLLKLGAVSDETVKAQFETAAHDLVVNGAGSYLVAAAFPAKAGLNDNSSLSAEYWRRFTEGLDALNAALVDWLTPVEDGGTPGGEAGVDMIVSSFPPVAFPDPVPGYAPKECPPGTYYYPHSW